MKGLVIKSPWIEKILAGEKFWEIRGSITNIRGTIALIKSGSGMILGTAELTGCLGPLSLPEMTATLDKHHNDLSNGLYYPKTYAWVLQNVNPFDIPIGYKHPQGAVIWVNLESSKGSIL